MLYVCFGSQLLHLVWCARLAKVIDTLWNSYLFRCTFGLFETAPSSVVGGRWELANVLGVAVIARCHCVSWITCLCCGDFTVGPVELHIMLIWAISSPKCKKCSVMLLKVERIRCKQLSGALEAERFARPSV